MGRPFSLDGSPGCQLPADVFYGRRHLESFTISESDLGAEVRVVSNLDGLHLLDVDGVDQATTADTTREQTLGLVNGNEHFTTSTGNTRVQPPLEDSLGGRLRRRRSR